MALSNPRIKRVSVSTNKGRKIVIKKNNLVKIKKATADKSNSKVIATGSATAPTNEEVKVDNVTTNNEVENVVINNETPVEEIKTIEVEENNVEVKNEEVKTNVEETPVKNINTGESTLYPPVEYKGKTYKYDVGEEMLTKFFYLHDSKNKVIALRKKPSGFKFFAFFFLIVCVILDAIGALVIANELTQETKNLTSTNFIVGCALCAAGVIIMIISIATIVSISKNNERFYSGFPCVIYDPNKDLYYFYTTKIENRLELKKDKVIKVSRNFFFTKMNVKVKYLNEEGKKCSKTIGYPKDFKALKNNFKQIKNKQDGIDVSKIEVNL